MRSTSFEAWKNFILILAAVLFADVISSPGKDGSFFQNVEQAVSYILVFDKVLNSEMSQLHCTKVVTILVELYFLKSIHGIIVSVFSDGYYRHLTESTARAMASCALATLVVISMTFVPLFTVLASDQRTPDGVGLALMMMVAVPTAVFIGFDLFRFRPRGVTHHARRFFAGNKDFEDVVATWVIEDVLSVALLLGWFLLTWSHAVSEELRIVMTILVLSLFLIINSLLDYVANRTFFFSFLTVASPQTEDWS
jgi:hypothetical protein